MLILKKTITNDDTTPDGKAASTALVVKHRPPGDDSASAASTSGTSRTSIGRSVRAGFASYSEKFLAERDEERKAALVAIREGQEVDIYGGAPVPRKVLALTDGPIDEGDEDGSARSRGSASVDPDADHASGKHDRSASGGFNTSTRRGVYGGGVRYFTPVQVGAGVDFELLSNSLTFECRNPQLPVRRRGGGGGGGGGRRRTRVRGR